MKNFASWDRLAQDVRYGVRLLARNPGFTVAALLTLSLGIGANTAIFSLVEGLLLKPLPYHDSRRIVVPATVFQRRGSSRGSVPFTDILDWKAQTALFDSVSAYRAGGIDLTGGSEPQRLSALTVDEDYFRVMGSPMLHGRAFTVADNLSGAPTVVVLGYSTWMRFLGGDLAAVETDIEINGKNCRIIGVSRPDSTWPGTPKSFAARTRGHE